MRNLNLFDFILVSLRFEFLVVYDIIKSSHSFNPCIHFYMTTYIICNRFEKMLFLFLPVCSLTLANEVFSH